MILPAIYRTRCGIEVTLTSDRLQLEEDGTVYKGYFLMYYPQEIRIWIYYNKDLNEINGERELDLVQRVSSPDRISKS